MWFLEARGNSEPTGTVPSRRGRLLTVLAKVGARGGLTLFILSRTMTRMWRALVVAVVMIARASLAEECVIAGWAESMPLRAENGEVIGTLVAGTPITVTVDERELLPVQIHHRGTRLEVFVRHEDLWLAADRDLSFDVYRVPAGAAVVTVKGGGVVPPPRPEVRVVKALSPIQVPGRALRLWRSVEQRFTGSPLDKPLAISAKPGEPPSVVLEAGVRVDVTAGSASWSRVCAGFDRDGASIVGWAHDRPEFRNSVGASLPTEVDGMGPPQTRQTTECSRALPLFLLNGNHTTTLGTLDVGTRFVAGTEQQGFVPIEHLESRSPIFLNAGAHCAVRAADLSSCWRRGEPRDGSVDEAR